MEMGEKRKDLNARMNIFTKHRNFCTHKTEQCEEKHLFLSLMIIILNRELKERQRARDEEICRKGNEKNSKHEREKKLSSELKFIRALREIFSSSLLLTQVSLFNNS
jgi:hypothetical protein